MYQVHGSLPCTRYIVPCDADSQEHQYTANILEHIVYLPSVHAYS